MSDFDDHDPLADTKEVFHAWVRSFDAFHDDEYLFEQLAYCEDLLTNELCNELGLKANSTYGDAVNLFRSQWADVGRGDESEDTPKATAQCIRDSRN
jgi:hypothetical protein